MALDAAPPTKEPSRTDYDVAPKIEDIEEVKAAINEKPIVDVQDAVFIADIRGRPSPRSNLNQKWPSTRVKRRIQTAKKTRSTHQSPVATSRLRLRIK